jgi:ATP-dependent RNA helicase DOB1
LCENDIQDLILDFLTNFLHPTELCGGPSHFNMASNDLFSFLNNDNDSEISDSETALNAMQVDNVSNTTPSNKRPATSPVPEMRMYSLSPSPPLEGGPPAKRKRLDIASTSAPAVVVDEFETEAKREVAASAGLTGATETAGSRLELRYQARLHWSFLELLADCRF